MTYKYISQNGTPGPRFWELRQDYIESVVDATSGGGGDGVLDTAGAMYLLRLLVAADTPRELFGVIQRIREWRLDYFVGRVDVVEYQFPSWVVWQGYQWDVVPPKDGRRKMRHNYNRWRYCPRRRRTVKTRLCRTRNVVLEARAWVLWRWRVWRRPELVAPANRGWHYQRGYGN